MSLEFLITSLIVILMPGTGVLYTLAVGLGRGLSASAAAAFGCTLGIVPSALAAILGLAAVFHASALAFQLLKYAGVAYLLYMAWSMLREGGALDVSPRTRPEPYLRLARNGMLLNVLNPKLSVFFLAFLPQFMPAGDPAGAGAAAAPLAGLALVFMALTFVVFLGYGAAASAARAHVLSRPAAMAWLRRSFAAAFALLGARLALAER